MTETAKSYEDLQAKCARQEQEIAQLIEDLRFFKEQFELSRPSLSRLNMLTMFTPAGSVNNKE